MEKRDADPHLAWGDPQPQKLLPLELRLKGRVGADRDVGTSFRKICDTVGPCTATNGRTLGIANGVSSGHCRNNHGERQCGAQQKRWTGNQHLGLSLESGHPSVSVKFHNLTEFQFPHL